MSEIVNIILHVDEYLQEIIANYGTFAYLVLFLIIFVETGLVITPFLPGDSILFAAGTFAALGSLDIVFLSLLLFLAAVLGDTVNYWLGHSIGPKVFERNSHLIKKEHLIKTQKFYQKHGGKTIVMARFIPIVRTFAPFVAGVGTMSYPKFIGFNVLGGALWVSLFLFGGFFFGNIPQVKNNFEIVIFIIIIISIFPMIMEFIKGRRKNKIIKRRNSLT